MKFIFLGFCNNSKGNTSILQIWATLSACKLESDVHELQIKKIAHAKEKKKQFLLIGFLG